MAIIFTLVAQGSNHCEYIVQSTGSTAAFDTGTVQATGAGDANVALEDVGIPPAGAHWNAGLLKQVMDLDNIADQDMARRQLLDWGLPPVVGDGILNVQGKRCRAYLVPILPAGPEVQKNWSIDADDDGAGKGEYNIACTAVGSSRARLIIEAIGTPLQF